MGYPCEDGLSLFVERATKGRVQVIIHDHRTGERHTARMSNIQAVAFAGLVKGVAESLPPLELTDEERRAMAETLKNAYEKVGPRTLAEMESFRKLLLEGRAT